MTTPAQIPLPLPIIWLSSRKLKANISPEDEEHMTIIPSSTRKCDMKNGLYIYPEHNSICFRLNWARVNQQHQYTYHQHAMTNWYPSAKYKNNWPAICQSTGQYPTVDHFAWKVDTMRRLSPLAERLYDIT
jgi:hypothetical protein